jgi:cytochrome c peroxidase
MTFLLKKKLTSWRVRKISCRILNLFDKPNKSRGFIFMFIFLFYSTLSFFLHHAHADQLTPLSPGRIHSRALQDLGRRLFFDERLSRQQNISCATCHHPSENTADGIPLSIGSGGTMIGRHRQLANGQRLQRHAPALFNTGLPSFNVHFWDARLAMAAEKKILITPHPWLNTLRDGESFRYEFRDLIPETGTAERKILDLMVKDLFNHEAALAAQALFPLLEPKEMMGTDHVWSDDSQARAREQFVWWQTLTERFKADPIYQDLMQRAFRVSPYDNWRITQLTTAMAAFIESTFQTPNTPYDRYLRGETSALSAAEKRGLALFSGKARCIQCHQGPHLSNFSLHNTGIPTFGGDLIDRGRADLGFPYPQVPPSRRWMHLYHFKTPPLRQIAHTAPYMHNGIFQTLEEVVKHYNDPIGTLRSWSPTAWIERFFPDDLHWVKTHTEANQEIEKNLSPNMLKPLHLSAEEQADLVLFLRNSLSQGAW